MNRAWFPSLLIPLRHQNCTHPLMSLMSLLLQSHQGFFTCLGLFLIFLNLYDCINWSLGQAQQKSFMGLSQSLPPMRHVKARPKTGFCFSVQKRPVPESSGTIWQRGFTWRVGLRLIKVAGSLLVDMSLAVLLTPGWRGAIGVSIPVVLQFTTSSSSPTCVMQVGMLSHFG